MPEAKATGKKTHTNTQTQTRNTVELMALCTQAKWVDCMSKRENETSQCINQIS